MISNELDAAAVRAELDRSRVAALPNFLFPDEAEELNFFLSKEMASTCWKVAVHDGVVAQYFDDVPENNRRIEEQYARASSVFSTGGFGYRFKRTFNNHQAACSCPLCRFGQSLRSDPMLRFIRDLDLEIGKLGEYFAACYEVGDFLAPHHDRDNGRLGFVLNLSQGWRPQFGGVLFFLNSDWLSVSRIFPPTFNTLILFRIPQAEGVPHFVSHVVAGKRLSIGGWYSV